MAVFINNFTSISRGKLSYVKEVIRDFNDEVSLDELCVDNIESALESIRDGYTEWTVDVNSGIKVGDINIFSCSSTSKDNIRMLRNSVSGNMGKEELLHLDNLCDEYNRYAGKLISIGVIDAFISYEGRMAWVSVKPIIGLDNPIPIDEFRSFISISKTGTMTRIHDAEFKRLLSIITTYNPGIDLSSIIMDFKGHKSTRTTAEEKTASVNKKLIQETKKLEKEVEEYELVGEEKRAYVKVRVNQGEYRERLLRKYDHCCLCKVSDKRLLIASHIKPWVDSNGKEKMDLANGLLLCPNHDKLFDKGYISFDSDKSIIVSSLLSKSDQEQMGVSKNMNLECDEKCLDYIKYHREHVFEKE